jgi:integrase
LSDLATLRRARGEGSIFRDDGRDRWIGQVDLGLDPDGRRRRRKVSGRTRAEVARKLRELRRAEERSLDLSRQAPNVAQVARDWFSKSASGRKAPSTLSRLRPRIERHIVPAIGNIRLDMLRPEHIESWLAQEAAAGKAQRTIADYRQTLSEILTWCERRRLIGWNPARVAELPRDARAPVERRTLTPGQIGPLLAALENERLGPYFKILILCGLRPGEADALAWSAVDFDARTIHIARALQRGDGGHPIAIGSTKSKRTRTLGLPTLMIDALMRQRNQQEADRALAGAAYSGAWPDLVFLSEVGTPLHPSNVRRTFHNVCERAGLPLFTPYEMRHSAASLLVAAGVPPFEVADVLGHADLRMLERHYRHRIDSVVTGAVSVMDALGSQSTFGSQFGSQRPARSRSARLDPL